MRMHVRIPLHHRYLAPLYAAPPAQKIPRMGEMVAYSAVAHHMYPSRRVVIPHSYSFHHPRLLKIKTRSFRASRELGVHSMYGQ